MTKTGQKIAQQALARKQKAEADAARKKTIMVVVGAGILIAGFMLYRKFKK